MVCVTPRVEPGFWLGDNITEARPHQPGLEAPPKWGGTGGPSESHGSSVFLLRAFLCEIRTVA